MDQQLKILSLDGGGFRGLSSLVMLQTVFNMFREELNPPQPNLKPCQYFDLIAGTSTGGIIALLLGRLRFSIEECIAIYSQLGQEVFGQQQGIGHEALFDASRLEDSVQRIVESATGNRDEPLLDPLGNRACKVAVFSINEYNLNPTEPEILRTYRGKGGSVGDGSTAWTIWEAARATSAAPTFFQPLTRGEAHHAVRWYDAGLGHNNPARVVRSECCRVWGRYGQMDWRTEIGLFLSLGTGVPRILRMKKQTVTEYLTATLFRKPIQLADYMVNLVTDTQKVAGEMDDEFSGTQAYFRFNVEQGLSAVELFEFEKEGMIRADTKTYMIARTSKTRACARKMERLCPAHSADVGLQEKPDDCGIVPQSLSNSDHQALRDRREQLIKSLAFEQMHARHASIKSADAKTCQWILGHTAYIDWTHPERSSQNSDFLWICGKPGAGKSILMKFALANYKKKHVKNEIIVSFFFNARGESLERSITGMYRSLLLQLLHELPQLHFLLDNYRSLPGDTWTTELLQDLFIAITQNLGHRNVRCFVDALDECDVDEIQEMIVFFEDLANYAQESGSRMYACFASRHYPVISIRLGQKLTLEDEDGHHGDLIRYIERHLQARDGKALHEARAGILEKAKGIFMWVALVVQLLNKQLSKSRIFAIKETLDELPAELNDLFKHILARDNENLHEFKICLQCILFAAKPLKREEFYFAITAGLDSRGQYVTEWDSTLVTLEHISDYVQSSSKGLAEVTQSDIPTVQFIHESVRDFLIGNSGLAELWSGLRENPYGKGHEQLKQCCSIYLMSSLCKDQIRNQKVWLGMQRDPKECAAIMTARFPFLRYATENILFHANEAANAVAQGAFLSSFALELDVWVRAHNLLATYRTRHYTPMVRLLYILADLGYARLIRQGSHQRSDFNHRSDRYYYPLFAALWNDHEHAVRALLELEDMETTPAGIVLPPSNFVKDISLIKDKTPLMWAIAHGHTALAEFIIMNTKLKPEADHLTLEGPESVIEKRGVSSSGASKQRARGPSSERDVRGRTHLHYAVATGIRELVLLLLESGADVTAADTDRATVLHYAASNGHDAITSLLLDCGANIKTKARTKYSDLECSSDERYTIFAAASSGTALHCAASQGYTSTLRLLFERGSSVDSVDFLGQTALYRAVLGEHIAAVQLLLDQHADIEHIDKHGMTPLHRAAHRGLKTAIQALLAYGAELEAVVKIDWSQSVRYSIQRPVQILDSEDNEEADALGKSLRLGRHYEPGGGTALHHAADQGHVEAMKVLLDCGANIQATDNFDMTALHRAVQSYFSTIGKEQYVSTVRLLLSRGASTEVKDAQGRKPLDFAIERKSQALLVLFKNYAAGETGESVESAINLY